MKMEKQEKSTIDWNCKEDPDQSRLENQTHRYVIPREKVEKSIFTIFIGKGRVKDWTICSSLLFNHFQRNFRGKHTINIKTLIAI